MLTSMLATVSVLSVNSTHTLPRRLGSDVPSYCGTDTKTGCPWGLGNMSLLCKCLKAAVNSMNQMQFFKNKHPSPKVQHGLRQSL